jgi:putative phage-type endonuclease
MNTNNEVDVDNDSDTVEFESLFSDDERKELIESTCEIIDNYIIENPLIFCQYNYQSLITDEVANILRMQLENVFPISIFNKCEEQLEDEIDNIIECCFKIIHRHIYPIRSFSKTFIRKLPNYEVIEKKLEILKHKPQPEQKSAEWYEFRHNHLTASSIWKALFSESSKNQLIYEKCKPFNPDKFNHVSTETPMHWGNKYEPLSIMFYEKHYGTKVNDYGCILHDTYDFLAASPDGINVLPLSKRYGRMLEIKNIVNREINGIPKYEYWIQMQFQMEVCDLNECDFLETRFVEYESKEDFDADGTFNRTANHELKGIIIYFVKDGKPHYEYAPLELSEDEFNEWQDDIMIKNEELTWVKTIYWKLDEVSCVLVLRNKFWFKHAVPLLQDVWKCIENEKINGFEHRAPKKREKKITVVKKKEDGTSIDIVDDFEMGKCLIDINEILGFKHIEGGTIQTEDDVNVKIIMN